MFSVMDYLYQECFHILDILELKLIQQLPTTLTG